jgi:hypothetical protein
VPEGALLTHTVEAVLQDLAASGATGCLLVRDQEGDEAEVFLRDGEVYAVSVPGRRVMLGVRLMSRGALTPEALAEALEIQRTELQGWRLGELLVHLGYVELSVVEEFVVEHLKDALADLLGWPVAAWKFRKNKKTRQDVAPPTPVAALFDELRHRATTWETILAATGGPAAVPTLAAASPSDDVALGPNEWALLCKIDATRSVADLAGECGFTLFEAGQVVMRLVEAGLVGVPGVPGDSDVSLTSRCRRPRRRPRPRTRPRSWTSSRLTRSRTSGSRSRTPSWLSSRRFSSRRWTSPASSWCCPSSTWPRWRFARPPRRPNEWPRRPPTPAEREQADRAARELTEAQEREAHRTAAENKRLREAEILHRELEALAAKEAAARAERAEARKRARAEMQAEQAATEAHNAAEAEAEAAAAQDDAVQEQPQDTRPDRDTAEELAWAEHTNHLAAERAVAEEPAWAEHAAWLAAERAAAEEPGLGRPRHVAG